MASMRREYYSICHILMHKSTELNYSKLNKRRVFQILKAKSIKQNLYNSNFTSILSFLWSKTKRTPLEKEINIPFFRAVSSGSRFLVTVTTLRTR